MDPPATAPSALAEATDAAPFFSLEGQTLEAKIVDAYDADTVRAVLMLSGAPTKFAVRLPGLDTPAKRSRRDLARRAPRAAHRALLRMLLDDDDYRALAALAKLTRKKVRAALGASRNTVVLRCGEFDKYGRLLARIEIRRADSQQDVCAALVGGGFAKQYDGGTKSEWLDEELERMLGGAEEARAEA